jgi:integrase
VVDVGVLDETAACLLAAASAPSEHTLASYTRRWRMWEAFAVHHGVMPLPADPEHVGAFVVARWRAGVSAAALGAGLSAILWFHRQLADELAGTCDVARRVLAGLRRGSERPSITPAPVLSVGALHRMVRVPPAGGTRLFSARLVRLLSGARPRQLGALRVEDVRFGPGDTWVEFTTPALPQAGKHPALPAGRFRFDRGRTALDCPVEALGSLVAASTDGTLFGGGFPAAATIKGFEPATARDGVPVRIAVRNRAIVKVGYAGALRVQELVRANVEHVEPAGDGYRLRLVDAKTSRGGRSQFVLLRQGEGPLDPVGAIDEWLAVRGDHDGPLFCTVHHSTRAGVAGGERMSDGEMIRGAIGDLAVAAGLPSTVSGYSLRRSWATHEFLRDPGRVALISRHLRHASVDATTRYIDDLGLGLIDATEFLSAESVVATPGGVTERRRDLGFASAPLSELLGEVATLARAATQPAARTQVVRRSHWRVWDRWATEHGTEALPASPEHLVLFAADRASAGVAAPSLREQLRSIRRAHEDAGYDASDLVTLADEIAVGLARCAPRERTKAPVLSGREVLAMAEAAKDRAERTGELVALQDLVLVTATYAGALRMDDVFRSRIEHLDELPYGLALRFTTSKANQTGRHPESVLLLSRRDALDPVAALAAWRDATGIGHGPLVPVLGRQPLVAMSRDWMPDRLRRLASDAGVATRPTGHSLRRSWATHAYEAGVDPVTISRHLRHRDLTTTLGYVARLSPWRDNAAQLVMDRAGTVDPPRTRGDAR